MQYATEPTDEPLRIKVYGGADGEFTLYLDDEKSYKYESGIYSELRFSYTESTKTLTIESEKDSYTDFKQNPIKLIIAEGGKEQEIIFNSKKTTIKL
ncbi:MAG: DUF5110 domain-containing protein [Rikenellaceae bacterium]